MLWRALLCLLLASTAFSEVAKRPSAAPAEPAAALRWPNAVIPYTIDGDVPQRDVIAEAMRHWEQRTPIRFVERTTQADYVRIQRSTGCSAHVGRIGGEQGVYLAPECPLANTIHEFGHTIGLWHEQSRVDRDRYLAIEMPAIAMPGRTQYEEHAYDSDAFSFYDYASIMHYGPGVPVPFGFSPVETKPGGIPIGLPDEISAGDIDAVRRLYGAAIAGTTISTHPQGLPILVDGVTYTAPQTFQWAPGSLHTVEVPAQNQRTSARFVFARWSDDAERARTIEASPDVTVFTAFFQVHLAIRFTTSQPDRGAVTVHGADASGLVFVTDGSPVQAQAVPKPGFRFLRWTNPDILRPSGFDNPIVRTVRRPANAPVAEYRAEFTPDAVTTITTDPPGLSVTVDGQTLLSPVNFTWAAGSQHTISVEAERLEFNGGIRRRFVSWSDGGAPSHTITALPGGASVTAKIDTAYKLSVSWFALNGRVEFTPPSPTGDEYWPAGSTIRLNAVPIPPFEFAGWSGDVTSSSTSLAVTLRTPLDIGAAFVQGPQMTRITNAASYLETPFAAGSIISIFGGGLGPSAGVTAQIDGKGNAPFVLAGTRVWIDGEPAGILYSSGRQVHAVVPSTVQPGTFLDVRLEADGRPAPFVMTIRIADAGPAIFSFSGSGRGQGAILNQDGTPNSPDNPASHGSIVSLYLTGLGSSPVRVVIGGRTTEVLYAGAAPGLAKGVYQINARVPRHIGVGANVPVLVEAAGIRSPNLITVSLKEPDVTQK